MKFEIPSTPTFDDFLAYIEKRKKLSSEDRAIFKKAYECAEKHHKGQIRKTGEPYIVHPLVTAYYLAELGMDRATVVAGFLHDTAEDTSYTLEELREDFGEEVTEIVDGVTRLGGVKYFGKHGKAEDLRKLLLIMAKDLRVIVVKLADRLHNMQTIYALPSIKRKRIATETIEIFAPLAARLGMGEMKGMLEDLSFKYYLPQEYKRITQLVGEDSKEKEQYIKDIIFFLNEKLKENHISAHIEGRAKHLYSLYKKLDKYNNDLSKIYDLEAIRIIVDNIGDCYKTLGIIHKEWNPLPKRIKDYIALPKPNGYRSLHTTVFALAGKIIEIQIKTWEMHREAEWGIAAHWHYKENKSSREISDKLKWINRLVSWQQELSSSEFMEGFKIDVFRDRIFVFTPRGEAMDLPEGSTPIDFAYLVHTAIGNSCIGAKVNKKIVPLSTKLQSGDLVEIITSKKQLGPSRDWIKFAKTPLALHEIRKALRSSDRNQNLEVGKELLNEELKKIGKSVDKITKKDIENFKAKTTYPDIESILVAIGEGFLKPKKVVTDLFYAEEPEKKKRGIFSRIIPIFKQREKKEVRVVVQGEENVLFNMASCCNPKPYDQIKGFVTIGKGVSIHKADCPNIKNVKDNRIVDAAWKDSTSFECTIYLEASPGGDLLKDLTELFSSMKVKILGISLTKDKLDRVTAKVDIGNEDKFKELMETLSDLSNIKLVKRIR